MSNNASSTEETADSTLTYADWNEALRDGTILGQECPECGHATAAPKAACARCGCRTLETTELPTTGTVFTKTALNVTPANFQDAYTVAIVSLGDAHIMAQMGDDVAIGDDVELTTVLEKDSRVAPVFDPV